MSLDPKFESQFSPRLGDIVGTWRSDTWGCPSGVSYYKMTESGLYISPLEFTEGEWHFSQRQFELIGDFEIRFGWHQHWDESKWVYFQGDTLVFESKDWKNGTGVKHHCERVADFMDEKLSEWETNPRAWKDDLKWPY